jgi:hypothetical protein
MLVVHFAIELAFKRERELLLEVMGWQVRNDEPSEDLFRELTVLSDGVRLTDEQELRFNSSRRAKASTDSLHAWQKRSTIGKWALGLLGAVMATRTWRDHYKRSL